MRGVFSWIVSNPSLLKVVDFLNIWGLILIGLGLLFGIFTRAASISGILLLLLYYLAHPSFIGVGFDIPTEGNYLIVDNVLVKLLALAVLALFPTSSMDGFKRIIFIFYSKLQKIFHTHTSDKKPFEKSNSHPIDYWSAKSEQEHDNIWCTNPEETIKYMENLEQPWIAYKILAAGAIYPNIAFRYAFKNGADFICVGMYDFQIVDDVNIALDTLADSVQRNRPWIV